MEAYQPLRREKKDLDLIMMWVSLAIPLSTTLFCFVYGLRCFFKKGKPLFVQSLTMAMGSHALGSIYQLCITISTEEVLEGFTPAYLGRIGFFLFIIAANYGQLDRIIDDGSKKMRSSRCLALIAPLCAGLLYIPNALLPDVPVATKVTYALVWIPAMIGVYFTLKHAIIPDLDFGFIKALKPYNAFALCLCFAELACLTAWDYLYGIPMILTAVLFGVLSVCTILAARRGVDKWTI